MDEIIVNETQLEILREVAQQPIRMPSPHQKDIVYLYGRGLVGVESNSHYPDPRGNVFITLTDKGRKFLGSLD